MENHIEPQVAGYKIIEKIGVGGFGVVYGAFQPGIEREVAIKAILPDIAQQPDFVRRFEAEAQLIARLEHMNIVPLYDYWRDPQGAYLVMRWLRGGSLADRLKQGALRIEAAGKIITQIASALMTAHQRNIIHRDIKPANILLDEEGNAYLTDFGIAKDNNNLDGSATAADMIIGSLDYISPEQARSEAITPRTDIYSLGVVLYEMLAGEHPFPNLSSVERMYKHINDPLPHLDNLPPKLRDQINQVIQQATAKKPADRFDDVLAFANAFLEAAHLKQQPIPESLVELLTPREQEVLQLMVNGLSNREIADKLVVAVGSVKSYQSHLYRKLRVKNRVQAIARGRELDLFYGEDTPSQTLMDAGSTVLAALPEPENPYKGLQAFQLADSHDFFGRDKIIQKLTSRLNEKGRWSRFLAIVGPSGSGKSSLVNAGLIPALLRGEVPGSDRWFVAEMLPGPRPLDELEVALIRVATKSPDSLQDQLQRDGHGLTRAANIILPDDGSELVLVIDQFEEIFTLSEDEALREHLLNLLYYAVTAPRSRVRVIITLRADFYDRPLHYPDFGEMLRNRMETVLPLSAGELEQAILRPARQAGIQFEDGLVASIVGEVNYQTGALPLLQYALTELFDRREGHTLTHEAYQAIGGTVGALAKRADQIYLEFDEEGQAVTRQMFLRLVTLGEGIEDTRRRVARSELMAITRNEDLINDVIDTFASYRLLSLDHDPATRSPVVEVAHEAILREWERLRLWLNDSRDEIRLQRALANAHVQWQAADHDASFLLRGARLEQYEDWVFESSMALTAGELSYLEASLEERQRLKEQESLRQEREKRLKQRSRWFLQGLVAVFAIATVIAAGLTGFAMNERNDAVAARTTAEDNFTRAERQRLAGLANILLQDDHSNVEIAAILAIRSLNMGYSGEGDTALNRVMTVNLPQLTVPILPGTTDVEFSPDGQFLLASSPEQGTVNLLNRSTGEIVRRFEESRFTTRFRFSFDSTHVLLANAHRGYLRDIQTAEVLHEFDLDTCRGAMPAVAFAPNTPHLLASNDEQDQLVLWDSQTFEEVQHFTGYSECVREIVFSPEGRLIAGEDKTGTVTVWDVQTGEIAYVLSPFALDGGQHHLTFSSDSRFLLTASSQSHEASLWDIETGRAIRVFAGHTGAISAVAASSDGRYAFTASLDATVRMWDLDDASEVRRYGGCGEWCTALSISPDGRHIAASGEDLHDDTARILVWDMIPTVSPLLIGHTNDIVFGVFSPDGRYVITGGEDHTARLWDAQSGELLHILSGHNLALRAATFSADSGTVYTSSDDRAVKAWSTATGEEIQSLFVDTVATDLSLSPDEKQLALVCDFTHTVFVQDAQTGEVILNIGSQIRNVDFAPHGSSVLTTSADSKLEIWDVNTGEQTREIVSTGEELTDAVYSPDGEYILSTASDGLTSIWNAKTGDLVRDFSGHAIEATRVAFSADSRVLLTGTTEGTVHVWEIATGRELRRISAPDGALSPDGRSVLTYGDGKTAKLWSVDYTESVEYLCSQLPRDLTAIERRQYGITDNTPTCPGSTEQ